MEIMENNIGVVHDAEPDKSARQAPSTSRNRATIFPFIPQVPNTWRVCVSHTSGNTLCGSIFVPSQWSSFQTEEILCGSNECRATSWSWAAVDGSIFSEWIDPIPRSNACCMYTWPTEVVEYPTPVLISPQNTFGGVFRMSAELQLRVPIEMFNVHEYSHGDMSSP